MKVNINNDGINVRLSIENQASILGKTGMVSFTLIGLIIMGIAIAEWLLGLLIMGTLWCMFFGWLTLWNFYGKELLVINTKSLSYQHIYGFYKTAQITKKINKALNISLVQAGIHHETEHFNLIFESYNTCDLPEEIYRTALPITKKDLDILKINIRQLYFEKVDPDLFNQPYMLN
ncbi:hypothetical protein [Pedobacter sp.]|uniref:hypothetical protein n=1 Tax=Pedobacter sp. TaxID=1411316 RepID=UPI002BC46BC5|nr:hypothetical protein [Pedobacter sp.]HWW38956.1 hypothetical protein [Pedobacter sp.]